MILRIVGAPRSGGRRSGAASGGVSPALYGVPAGLLSGAMVARTLMARRKQAVEAPSE